MRFALSAHFIFRRQENGAQQQRKGHKQLHDVVVKQAIKQQRELNPFSSV